MKTADLAILANEASRKLKERLGVNGTAIIILSVNDSDGPAIATSISGDLLRAVGILELGADIVSDSIRKSINMGHVPRR